MFGDSNDPLLAILHSLVAAAADPVGTSAVVAATVPSVNASAPIVATNLNRGDCHRGNTPYLAVSPDRSFLRR
jgi:hypothetical protein